MSSETSVICEYCKLLVVKCIYGMFDVQYIIIALSGLRCANRHYTTFMQFHIIMHQKLGQE